MPAPASAAGLEDNPAPPARAASWHQVVGVQFAGLLLDIPFPILLVLTLWRLPWCVRRLILEVHTLIYSINPSFSPFPPVFLTTPFHLLLVLNFYIKQCDTATEKRIMILRFLWGTLKDIPCILIFLFIVVCAWRIPSLIRLFKEVCLPISLPFSLPPCVILVLFLVQQRR